MEDILERVVDYDKVNQVRTPGNHFVDVLNSSLLGSGVADKWTIANGDNCHGITAAMSSHLWGMFQSSNNGTDASPNEIKIVHKSSNIGYYVNRGMICALSDVAAAMQRAHFDVNQRTLDCIVVEDSECSDVVNFEVFLGWLVTGNLRLPLSLGRCNEFEEFAEFSTLAPGVDLVEVYQLAHFFNITRLMKLMEDRCVDVFTYESAYTSALRLGFLINKGQDNAIFEVVGNRLVFVIT